ncbi:MAG TPA: hypothetical protein VGH28_20525 [Polyangiaceae bacterium]|jgi:hypothetical protein
MSENKTETVVDTLFDVGEAWASHGLKIAESALTASAKTLTMVSKLLGNLAVELEKERRVES